MQETTNQYPVGFYFSIAFDDLEQCFFQEVSGLSNEMNVEEVVSGGENRFKYRIPTVSTSKNLVLKRGMFPKTSSLLKWCEDTLEGGWSALIQTKTVKIHLLNEGGTVMMKWIFHGAYPVKYAVSDLKSQENELLIETLELAYTYFQIETL
ncbi:phage tail protein [uncultured Dokdonia sp.]|uniref:phage tail protein n=1 Tax=uncultured Dokdonia sp. TaxID=575653 RepID=UPI002627D19B|nr:phage tail protein [uncultured Dokdonia sp.]